ncbi:7-methylguanosine phosphate-specific 5'-nucleotidase isoform X2 [Plodia interpunctella]|nr:7-methylguanosine phosphate-specific 5'-nucleotidase isoform X2 [Plodia interpunctella]XP_053599647.1 7-methylguanosine phosphate-specific 5'-nucleotidase isoform X2 [Plodia interpunctella]
MKTLSSLKDIPALSKSNVHIRNEIELLNKINSLITLGSRSLQIVTDFDHTLTRHTLDNGNTVRTSFGMFTDCPSVPQKYRDEDLRLSNIYKPIECDGTMSVEEKTKHMVDWYVAANNLLKGLTFPRNELKIIGASMKEHYRTGVKEMIDWSEQKSVPVLVFSAGLGDSVVAALEGSNFLRPNVKVVANFLAMDGDDKIVGIKGDIIHTLNKNETAIHDTEYFDLVQSRAGALLLGDNLGDAAMAAGMPHCRHVLRVGFLSRNVDENLQNYLEKFDIVLTEEHSMDVPNSILELIL